MNDGYLDPPDYPLSVWDSIETDVDDKELSQDDIWLIWQMGIASFEAMRKWEIQQERDGSSD
jgi:hypothetical protein